MQKQLKPREKRGLSRREEEFCRLFLFSGDKEAAARKAGYQSPRQTAERLLKREDILLELGRRFALEEGEEKEKQGYARLAFGDIADAVSLLYREDMTPQELSAMDLYNVSEIKRAKGGAMEIRFYDRMQALARLSEEETAKERRPDILEAIRDGARALYEGKEEIT